MFSLWGFVLLLLQYGRAFYGDKTKFHSKSFNVLYFWCLYYDLNELLIVTIRFELSLGRKCELDLMQFQEQVAEKYSMFQNKHTLYIFYDNHCRRVISLV